MAKKPKALPSPNLTPYQREQVLAMIDSARARMLDIDPDMEKDASLWFDSLDGESDVIDVFRYLGRGYVEREALAEMTKGMANDLKARADRFGRQAEAIKATLYALWQVAEIPGLTDPWFTAYLMTIAPKVDDDIDNHVHELPKDYVRVKLEANRTLILDHLKKGIEVPHARLTNGSETLVIRGK